MPSSSARKRRRLFALERPEPVAVAGLQLALPRQHFGPPLPLPDRLLVELDEHPFAAHFRGRQPVLRQGERRRLHFQVEFPFEVRHDRLQAGEADLDAHLRSLGMRTRPRSQERVELATAHNS